MTTNDIIEAGVADVNYDILEVGVVDKCCANCGVAEIYDIKLMDCDGGCDLTRYCGVECQKDHREKHEAICKERAAELRDEILFKQPESSYLGDCPICFLPLPLDRNKFGMYSCCAKDICNGCEHANKVREMEQRLKSKCVFCRKRLPKTDEEIEKNHEKRAEANDPVALRQTGKMHDKEGEYDSALHYYSRAAELGDAMAHYNLSIMYREGRGVEKDAEKARYLLEEAAIAGHPHARHNLGCDEYDNERHDRAVKHWIIAANLGDDSSLHNLKVVYKNGGHVSKDDLAAALRAHQAAVDATKSPQRKEAEEFRRWKELSGNLPIWG